MCADENMKEFVFEFDKFVDANMKEIAEQQQQSNIAKEEEMRWNRRKLDARVKETWQNRTRCSDALVIKP